ncbi:HAMP domain-containing histidine kinase [Novosphingobium profundi]|uniref:sensor histidine kinase n=1 Tax=Novosphingobium profundi TaxID=1774954 RepID=UPI001BD95A81|nr:HAMP domain-containing sensor histidine kinase [Novosphingobium profundi]MBT0667490.1 HAMP domain-containing histidine kinase [Novosphingobium profundi]
MNPLSAPRQARRRWSWRSLRVRLLLASLVWICLGIAGIWYSATRLFAKHVELNYHDELQVHVKELGRLVRIEPDGTLRLDRPLSDPRFQIPDGGFYWQVSLEGHAPLRSASLTRGKLDAAIAHDSSIHHHVENGPTGPAITYGFVRHVPGRGNVHYVIATDQRILDEIIASFDRELTLWLALLAALLASTGVLFVTFGLRPLDRLGIASARLREGSVDRLAGSYPTEIAPLVSDLNIYIEHSEGAVERARLEAGNLAHSLRTPLAVITDEAERLALAPDTARAGRTLLEQSRLMVQQIEYQLARARAIASARRPGTVSRIGEVMPPLLSAMERLHRDKAFVFTAGDGVDPALPVDPVDLSEVVAILLDNAGKWASGRVSVEVEQAKSGDRAGLVVRILDDGPGLAPERIEKAFAIGSRFDTAMPGSGLGLAIARDIAEAYGLALELGARPDGAAGLAATLTLPTSLDTA